MQARFSLVRLLPNIYFPCLFLNHKRESMTQLNPTPDHQPPAVDPTHQEAARAADRARYDRERLEGHLRAMMDHVGLADVPTEALGGNHPSIDVPGRPMEVRYVHPPDPFAPAPSWPPERQRDNKRTGQKTKTKRKRQPDPHRRPPLPASVAPPRAASPDKPDPLLDDLQNPNPVALALRLQMLMWEKKLNITELARELGRSRSYVRNHLRLLQMPNSIVEWVKSGQLTEGHARVIGKMRDPEAIARLVMRRQLSVRQTETIARRLRYIGPDGQLLRDTAIPNSKHVEDILEDALGAKVIMKDRAGRGKIEIHYRCPAEASRLVDELAKAYAAIHPKDLDPNY